MHRALLELVEADGERHRIRVECLGSFPILRNDVWLEESHVRFHLESGSQRRTGHGVVEHVWRAETAEITARAERLRELMPALRL